MRYGKICYSAQIVYHILDDNNNLPWWWCIPLKCLNHYGIVSFNKELNETYVSYFFKSIPQRSCLRFKDTGLSIMCCSYLDKFTHPVPYDESNLQQNCVEEIRQNWFWQTLGGVPCHNKIWGRTPVSGPPRRSITRHASSNSSFCIWAFCSNQSP